MILLAVPRALLAPLRAVVSIEREMRGLRGDMRQVVDGIEGLRDDVRAMQGGVGRISDATVSLESKVDELSVHIDALGALATRFGRFGGRRRDPELP